METFNSTQTSPNPAKPNQAASNPFMPNMAGKMMGGGPNVSRAFGEPITAQGRTIIPVAMVAMGFRGGFWGRVKGLLGNAPAGQQPANGTTNGAANGPASEGRGHGGMRRRMMVRPVGFIDVTNGDSRFVPIAPGRFVALGVVLGLVAGRFLAGRRRRMMQNYNS